MKEAKDTKGKLKLTLVPRQIIREIAKVREYGNSKYPDGGPDNWKRVNPQDYKDAAFRHFLAYLDDPHGVDQESGLPHLSHLACNIAFLCEFEETGKCISKVEFHEDYIHHTPEAKITLLENSIGEYAMTLEQSEFIEGIVDYMVEASNMDRPEAWKFGLRVWKFEDWLYEYIKQRKEDEDV